MPIGAPFSHPADPPAALHRESSYLALASGSIPADEERIGPFLWGRPDEDDAVELRT
jgi:hypothetical protein